MAYINIQTKAYPITEQDIRALNPNTSFATPFAAPEEYAVVFPAPRPEFNPVIDLAVEDAPVLTEKGHYEQTWKVVSKFAEYTDEAGVTHTVEEQRNAAIAADAAQKAETLKATIIAVVQERLDSFAKERNYDSILSAATYATSGNPKFRAEGQAAVDLRDATWAKLYEIFGEVLAGTRQVTSFDDIVADLPVLTWPQ